MKLLEKLVDDMYDEINIDDDEEEPGAGDSDDLGVKKKDEL